MAVRLIASQAKEVARQPLCIAIARILCGVGDQLCPQTPQRQILLATRGESLWGKGKDPNLTNEVRTRFLDPRYRA